MGIIGNRYLQGQPTLPYTNYKSLAGSSIFVDLQFVDHTQTAVMPTTISLEIDDITNCIEMLGPTVLNPAGGTGPQIFYPAFTNGVWTFRASGSFMQMSFPYSGSQICQFKFNFTALDSVTGLPFDGVGLLYIELCAVATVSGQ